MKFGTITLLFVIGGLFLLLAWSPPLLAGPGKTVRIAVPNLPSGG